MLNRITMTGRLVADPELRRTQSGVSVTSFRIANDRDYPSVSLCRQRRLAANLQTCLIHHLDLIYL